MEVLILNNARNVLLSYLHFIKDTITKIGPNYYFIGPILVKYARFASRFFIPLCYFVNLSIWPRVYFIRNFLINVKLFKVILPNSRIRFLQVPENNDIYVCENAAW